MKAVIVWAINEFEHNTCIRFERVEEGYTGGSYMDFTSEGG